MDKGAMFLFNDDEEMKPKPSEIKRLQEDRVKCIEKKKEDNHPIENFVEYLKDQGKAPAICATERYPAKEYEPIKRKDAEPHVEGMILVLQMDREIDKDKHYISPGGYEFKSSKSEEPLQFDFFDYAGYIDSNDKTKILFEAEALDEQTFPGIIDKLNKSFCEDINEITEFYIYTGEYEDPELNLSKIIDISLLFTDGTKIDIKPEVIDKFNNELKKGE